MQSTRIESIRDQVAAIAARLIAEDGLDYAGAKARALREVVGDDRRDHHDCMPDNARVVEAVREHQSLFMADTQPARLHALRVVARDVLRFLADGLPDAVVCATGAIVNGTAGEHSDVHLQLVDDNAKDVEIFLVNAGIDYDAVEVPGGETLSFLWPQRRTASPSRAVASQEAVHLSVLDPRARRGMQPLDRADVAALERLLADGSSA